MYCQLLTYATLNSTDVNAIQSTLENELDAFSGNSFTYHINDDTVVYLIPKREHAVMEHPFTSIYVVSFNQYEVVSIVSKIRDLVVKHSRSLLFCTPMFPLNNESLNVADHKADLLFGSPMAATIVRRDNALLSSVICNGVYTSIKQVMDFEEYMRKYNIGFRVDRIESVSKTVSRDTWQSSRRNLPMAREVRYRVYLQRGRMNWIHLVRNAQPIQLEWSRRATTLDEVVPTGDHTFEIVDRTGGANFNFLVRDALSVASLTGNYQPKFKAENEQETTFEFHNIYFI